MMKTTKVILPILMTRVRMIRLDPTAITQCLYIRLLAREKVNVEQRNNNYPVGRLGTP